MKRVVVGTALIVLMNASGVIGSPSDVSGSEANPAPQNKLALFGDQPRNRESFRSIYTQRFHHEPIVFYAGETMIA